MARRRNMAGDNETRGLLIDAAVELLRAEGQTAVSCRRLAIKTGLSHQIVHYYFRSMEELFLAVIKRACENRIDYFLRSMDDEQPLWTQWEQFNEQGGVQLEMEYMVLANRYPAVREELSSYRQKFRNIQIECLRNLFLRYQLDDPRYSPQVIAVFMSSVSRTMALEISLGATVAHTETRDFIQNFLVEIEGPRKKKPGRRREPRTQSGH